MDILLKKVIKPVLKKSTQKSKFTQKSTQKSYELKKELKQVKVNRHFTQKRTKKYFLKKVNSVKKFCLKLSKKFLQFESQQSRIRH